MYGAAAADHFERHPELLNDDGLLVLSLGSILIDSGGFRILVDLGWGPSTLDLSTVGDGSRRGLLVGGDLLGNLDRCGLGVDDIDLVVFTHLHADHIGWLLTDGALTFSRARYGMCDAEWQSWLDRSGDGSWGGPDDRQLEALRGRVETFGDGETLAEGVRFVWTPGHTPGHAGVVIESGGRRGIVLGDAMHCTLEMTSDTLALCSDSDPAAAASTRAWIRSEVAAGAVAIGPHFAPHVFFDGV